MKRGFFFFLRVAVVYIPFDFQKDFPEEYLKHIRFYCLVMSENYIRNHFADIKAYANAVEHRLDDGSCTIESLLEDNAYFLDCARKHHVHPILIEDEYDIQLNLQSEN